MKMSLDGETKLLAENNHQVQCFSSYFQIEQHSV